MSLINSTVIPNGAAFELEQSLRFNQGDDTNLSKTFASAGNRRTWSFSVWFKRGNTGGANNTTNKDVFFGGINDGNMVRIADDQLQFYVWDGSADYGWISTAFVRDTSAWYHALFVFDTTSSTATHRQRIYLNGVELTDKATDYGIPAQNYDGAINTAGLHTIGKAAGANEQFDGYLAEVNFIDGQALTPADFGETGTYGEWKPIEYEGSYGTNGFYLPFKQDYTVEGFSTVTWQGNSASSAYIGGAGFQPDLTWIKSRSIAASHNLVDSIRGANKRLRSDSTGSETNQSENGYVGSFNDDGFTLTQGSSSHGTYTGWFETNQSGVTYVGWNWDMGGSNANNTTGSTNSVVRANPTYGQSIVSYTGQSGAQTIGHGLSSTPEMIIVKNRSSAQEWLVYNHQMASSNSEQKYLRLDTTQGLGTNTFWNNTAPTSSVFSVGDSQPVNSGHGNNYVAYLWHSVSGYSSIGRYTGNGNATGPSVTTGFKVAFLLIKGSTVAENWNIIDATRSPTNVGNKARLQANASGAEGATWACDFNANGFQIKSTDGEVNTNGEYYIYMAFADKREYAYWLDQSGNNNDWTSNNLTESDISVDNPSNNFSTFNPLDPQGTTSITFSEGNLKAVQAASWTGAVNNVLMTSGKWYWEVCGVDMSNSGVGVIKPNGAQHLAMNVANNGYFGKADRGYGINFQHGNDIDFFTNTSETTQQMFSSYSNGDIAQVAYDADTGKIWIAKNNTWGTTSGGVGNPSTGANPAATVANPEEGYLAGFVLENCTIVANFGQDSSFAGNKTAQGNQDSGDVGDFFYTPPSGFKALCTSNLPAVAVVPSEHMNTVLYSGNGSTQTINTVVQPDLVWFKKRSSSGSHALVDAVRGDTKWLESDGTAAEQTFANNNVTTNATSIDLDYNGGYNNINQSSQTYVAWNWKAGGSGSSNTNGSINSAVSANADAGFSIVSYTGTGANATVGHGLSKAPDFLVTKTRSHTGDWMVYSGDATDFLKLNETNATEDLAAVWNDTSPTSSVFSLGSNGDVNTNGRTYIAYCFHSVDGYSKVGSYTGNGVNLNGPYVHTSFRPAYVLIKRTDSADPWVIFDSAREPENEDDGQDLSLKANDTAVEAAYGNIDFLSNGFKVMINAGYMNNNNSPYIYLAFAETPFKYSNAR
jgi:hypothetical protein